MSQPTLSYHDDALNLTLTSLPDELWEGQALGPDGDYDIALYTVDDEPPAPMQLEALRWAVTNLPTLRQAAIRYVQGDVQADLSKYGLLDEQDRPYWETQADVKPWGLMDESAYSLSFKLINLTISEDLSDSRSFVLGFETELDIEHGIGVQFESGEIVMTDMLSHF